MKLTVRDITTLSLMTALCIVLSVIDSYIPNFIVGMKLGIANIIILVSLYAANIPPQKLDKLEYSIATISIGI